MESDAFRLNDKEMEGLEEKKALLEKIESLEA